MTRGSSAGFSFAVPMRSPDPVSGVSDVLFVCHGNQCRSPFAAAIATRLGGDGALRFHSGGLLPGGKSMPKIGRSTGVRFGFDFEGHRSRELDLHDLAGFDLILTATRTQAREVLAEAPEVWPRLFTIKQFARWISDHPRPPRAALGSWLDSAASGRSRSTMLGESAEDDLSDPLLLPQPAWLLMVDELTRDLKIVVRELERRAE